jgi:glycosyltransferase involved in cell wall biosynthesis
LGQIERKSASRAVAAARTADRIIRYAKIVRRERYDIVDAWLYQGYGLAAVTRPLTRTPILLSGRVSLSGFKERFGPAERAVDAWARRSSDLIWANAAAVADDVALREGVDRGSLRIVHGGVHIPDPMPDEERQMIRERWGVAPDDLVVGYVGSMRKGKGHDRIVEAMPSVLDRAPSTRLVLVGGGPERAELERRIASLGLGDRVVMTGDVVDAWKLYGALDLFVSASEAEGLPNAVLEAAAAGLGIAATAAGGTVEIIEDGRTGILVPINDDAALRDAMIRLACDPGLRHRLGSAARDDVAARFGVDRFIQETGDMYEEMARRRGIPVSG